MLLLRAPTRRPNDVAISLRAPSGCARTAAAVADLARLSACPPAVAERVRICILHSGRYDCRISAAAALHLAYRPDLGRVGATIVLPESRP